MADRPTPEQEAAAIAALNDPAYRQRVADAYGVEYQGVKPTPPPAPFDPKSVTLPPARPTVVTLAPGESRPEETQAALDAIIEHGGGPTSLDATTAVKVMSGAIEVTKEQTVKARQMLEAFKKDRTMQELFEKGNSEMRGWFDAVTATIAMGELKGW